MVNHETKPGGIGGLLGSLIPRTQILSSKFHHPLIYPLGVKREVGCWEFCEDKIVLPKMGVDGVVNLLLKKAHRYLLWDLYEVEGIFF